MLDQGVAAATSSIVAATLTNPLEILRLRAQVRGFSDAQNYFEDIILSCVILLNLNLNLKLLRFYTSNIELKSHLLH